MQCLVTIGSLHFSVVYIMQFKNLSGGLIFTPWHFQNSRWRPRWLPFHELGHISATDHPIHFIFGSGVGFSGTADRLALFSVRPNPRWRLGRHLGKFKWRYLRNISSDSLHVWFQGEVFGVGRSNGTISIFIKSKMAAEPPSWKIQIAKFRMATSLQGIIQSTSRLVLGQRYRGRLIKWRFLIELQDTTRLVTLPTCCSSDAKPRRRSISSWDYRLTKG